MTEQSERVVSPEEAGHPPAPPRVGRGYGLHVYQYLGLPVLLAIVVLAVAGVFGESWDDGAAEGAVVALEWRYPTSFRYKQINTVRLRITNTGGAPLDTVHVSFEPSYLNAFSTVGSTPSFTDPWEIPVTDVQPGETRLVVVEIQGERYGRQEGELSVTAGADTLRARLSTLIFP